MSEVEKEMTGHGLGYMMRTLIPALDIEHEEEHTKEFLWNMILNLREEARKLNLRWKHVDIHMQIQQERSYDYYDEV